jgi:hypothetical protein
MGSHPGARFTIATAGTTAYLQRSDCANFASPWRSEKFRGLNLDRAGNPSSCLRHPQPNRQGAPDSNHGGVAQMAHPLYNFFARQRQHLIDHDLRYPIEAVLATRIESYAKQRSIDNRAGERHNRNTCMNIVEEIRLDDQGWPRFPVVALSRYGHNVAALQVQPSTDPAATSSKSSNCDN